MRSGDNTNKQNSPTKDLFDSIWENAPHAAPTKQLQSDKRIGSTIITSLEIKKQTERNRESKLTSTDGHSQGNSEDEWSETYHYDDEWSETYYEEDEEDEYYSDKDSYNEEEDVPSITKVN